MEKTEWKNKTKTNLTEAKRRGNEHDREKKTYHHRENDMLKGNSAGKSKRIGNKNGKR